eukprot:1159088-Pelagomonas_calceolata.AAC.13
MDGILHRTLPAFFEAGIESPSFDNNVVPRDSVTCKNSFKGRGSTAVVAAASACKGALTAANMWAVHVLDAHTPANLGCSKHASSA